MKRLHHYDVAPGHAVPLYIIPLDSNLGRLLNRSVMATSVVRNAWGTREVYLYHYNAEIISHELDMEEREELEQHRVQYIPSNDEVVEALRGPMGPAGPMGMKGDKGDPA